MNVLITGGTGFIGTNLALRYAREGHRVRVASREATEVERENARDLKQAGVETVLGDVRDGEMLATMTRGVQVVHHIAAAMREANMSDRAFWETNVAATRRLLEVSHEAGVKRFVYCSSIGAMGKSMRKPASEDSPTNPQDIYQRTKKAAEEACFAFHRQRGLPIAIMRPADVYGPRDRRLLKLFRSIKKGRFAMLGSGENEHHMVYVDDLVDGFVRGAEAEAAVGQVFILAGDRPTTLNHLVGTIARHLGVSIPRLRLPLAPVLALATVVEAVFKPLRLQPPLYRRRVDFFRSDYAFDIGKAKRLLGYAPAHDLDAGIAKTLAWYRERELL